MWLHLYFPYKTQSLLQLKGSLSEGCTRPLGWSGVRFHREKKPETPSARCHLPLYMQPSSGFMPHTAMKAWGWRKGAILPAKTMCPLLVRQRLLFTRTRKIRASLWPETESSFYRQTYGLSCSCPSKDSFMQKPDEHLKTLEAKQTQKRGRITIISLKTTMSCKAFEWKRIFKKMKSGFLIIESKY